MILPHGLPMNEKLFVNLVRDLTVDEAAFARERQRLAPAERCYVVYFSPRSGSTWLTAILAATQRLGFPEEYLNPNHVRAVAEAMQTTDAADLLRMLQRRRKTANGVFGIEVRDIDVHLFGRDVFFDVFGADTVFFHLWRDNIVAQGISLFRAVTSGQFHAKRGDAPAPAPAFDAEAIRDWISHVAGVENENVRGLQASGRAAHMICYENIIKDRAGTLAVFAGALGVSLQPEDVADHDAAAPIRLGDAWSEQAEARVRREHAAFVAEIEAARLIRQPALRAGPPVRRDRPAAPDAPAGEILERLRRVERKLDRALAGGRGGAPRPEDTLTQDYEFVDLERLASDDTRRVGDRPALERIEYRPADELAVPALDYGDTDLSDPGIRETPRQGAGALRLRCPPVHAYLLRNVLVHGEYGAVTQGGQAIAETFWRYPFHAVPGAAKLSETRVRLPRRPHAAQIPAAGHMLAGNPDNYYHWFIDTLSRYDRTFFERHAPGPEAPGGPVLLTPNLDQPWKWESVNLLISATVPRLGMAAEGNVFVQRLLYVPNPPGAAFRPHPAVLEMFDRARVAALGAAAPARRRRLYVARSDSRNRVLLNEAEVAARAEAAGFDVVVLAGMPVAEQIRLFASASHILAPHGAGLTNIAFCAPGTKLCELHMDAYVHWAFRSLAARRGVTYGCLIGRAEGERHASVHQNRWRVNLDRLDAMLADARFMA